MSFKFAFPFGTSYCRRLGGAWTRFTSLYLTSQKLTNTPVDLDGECMPIGITLWRPTDAHLGKLKRLSIVDTCCDAGCHDILHLAHALERPFSSLEELVLEIPLLDNMHQKLMQLIPAFPMLKNGHIVSRTNETSLDLATHN
ncbi:uncharacterized protein ARMOST_21501 [Armillaria ostoyae]|uniref:Uncharacterized protein n=1 Tax=Armillaria ostoyae TaxID=47428 RepID=A0A284SAA7_ARMOS|nr:uncharacterized protein ARMOST_21501 [Armillaria ostoyae]